MDRSELFAVLTMTKLFTLSDFLKVRATLAAQTAAQGGVVGRRDSNIAYTRSSRHAIPLLFYCVAGLQEVGKEE